MDLRHLDFRLKASWRSALEVLQQAAAAMAEWERNPPQEYKELFAEIDQAAAAYSASIDDLEALSGELQQGAQDNRAGLPQAAPGPLAQLSLPPTQGQSAPAGSDSCSINVEALSGQAEPQLQHLIARHGPPL